MGRSRGITLARDGTTQFGTCGQNGEASGLVPAGLHEDDTVTATMSDGKVPTLEEWTTEAILLESLQPERLDAAEAMAALERGHRAIINVEVESDASALAVARSFRENGYAADFFRCNCRCHDGHVLARVRPPRT